jgi:hypothetical protein
MSSSSLYREVVDATAVYLGPAADRFISRQIVGHLDKAPEKLKKGDLKELIKWIKPAIALLTEDTRVVDSYIDSLSTLSRTTKGRS